MPEKFVQRHTIGEERYKGKPTKMMSALFSEDQQSTEKASRVAYKEIPVGDITPRPINRYSQTRIDKLARSIRNTNNRLIHPIVIVSASSLPDDSDVIKRFREKGIDVSTLKYVIVSGERRFRAWMELRKEEEQRKGGELGFVNRFDTITANVLTATEASKEDVFFEDSNLEVRQLTPLEILLHVKDLMNDIQTEDEKTQALKEMGAPEGKKYNQAEYAKYYLTNEIGLSKDISLSTIKNYQAILANCIPEIVDEVIQEKMSPGLARSLFALDEVTQKELLEIFKNDREEFNARLAAIKKANTAPRTTRKTHKDAAKAISDSLRKIKKDRAIISLLVKELGGEDKNNTEETVKIFDKFIKELEAKYETLK